MEPKPRDWPKDKDWPGRKPGSYKWYEIQDEVAYFAYFEQPKIVFPVIAKEPRFAFDDQGVLTNDKAFILPVNDLYLLAVLNSTSAWAYLKSICSVLGDPDRCGRLELRGIYLAKLPIPNAPAADRNAIADLAHRCLDAKGQGPDVAAWEAEIDARVARLYELSTDEIAVAEGARVSEADEDDEATA